MKAFITVIGHDTVGVVAKVAALCCELNINIEDVTQSILQGMFAMIMLVDLSNCNVDHDQLHKRTDALAAYKFKGYWKDVGTIDSLWEANMDLIDSRNELNLNDPTWKIYTEDTPALPQYIGPNAKIDKAFITQGCVVEGEVKHSVLFTGCKVGEGAKIIDSVLMPGVEVAAGAVVQRALVADNVKIGQDAVVGSADSENIELVSKRVKGVE